MTERIGNGPDMLDDWAIEAMNDHSLIGMGVALVEKGGRTSVHAYGLADVEQHVPVTPHTHFRIGSISKTMTAIGLMQLWQERKVSLDDPVSAALHSYALRGARAGDGAITFRQLLTHTSGLGMLRSWTDALSPTAGLSVRAGRPVPSLKDFYASGLQAEAPPGVKWSYSNHAFATLGQVIEDLSGERFEEYMRRRVFEPLGMLDTDYLRSERARGRMARGYEFVHGRLVPVDDDEIVVRPAGSVISTLHDMGLYLTALLNGGRNQHGAVLEPETMQLMLQPHYRLDPHLPAMGLGFVLEEMGKHLIAWHDGAWSGFASGLFLAPDDGQGVFICTNRLDPDFDAVSRKLLRMRLGLALPAEPASARALDTPYLWPELAGHYGPAKGLNTNLALWSGLGGEVEVYVKTNHLTLRALWGPLRHGTRLYRVDPADPFVFQLGQQPDAQKAVFARGAGRVDRVYLGFFTLYKRAAWQSVRLRLAGALGLLSALGALLVRRRLSGTRSRARRARAVSGRPRTEWWGKSRQRPRKKS